MRGDDMGDVTGIAYGTSGDSGELVTTTEGGPNNNYAAGPPLADVGNVELTQTLAPDGISGIRITGPIYQMNNFLQFNPVT